MKDEKNTEGTAVENITVSSETLGNILNLSTRRIRQLADEGLFKKIKRGKYNLVENVHSYIAYLKTNNEAKDVENNDGDLDLDTERAKLNHVKVLQEELKLAAMKGTMHKSEDVQKVMNDMLSNFRSKLLALPSKVAPSLLAMDNISEIQEVLRRDIFEALEELSEYNPADFYNEDYIDLDDDIKIEEGDNIGEEKTKDKKQDN